MGASSGRGLECSGVYVEFNLKMEDMGHGAAERHGSVKDGVDNSSGRRRILPDLDSLWI